MLLIFQMALRNTFRLWRTSLITVLSIAFALALILWVQAILAGHNRKVIDMIASTHSGHLQIQRPDYVEEPSIQDSFTPPPAEFWKDLPKDVHYALHVDLPVLLSTGEESAPALLEGIDPGLEAGVSKLKDHLVEGKFLSSERAEACSSRELYLGKALAKTLNVGIDGKVVVLSQATDGTLGNELLRVVGFFDSGSRDFDKGYAFTTIPCVQHLGVISGVHEIALFLDHPETETEVRKNLQSRLPAPLKVYSWRETLPRIYSLTRYNDAMVVLVGAILLFVISFGVINTMLVSVFKRTQEIGLMISLGVQPWRVVALIVTESFLIGGLACVLGVFIGASVISYHAYCGFDLTPLVGQDLTVGAFRIQPIVHPWVSFLSVLKPIAVTWTVVTLAGVYPALRAARLDPIAAMRSL